MSVFDGLFGKIKNALQADLRDIILDLSTGNADRDLAVGKVTAKSVKFDRAAGVSVEQGEMAWNEEEETFDFGMNGATWQGGLENYFHVKNNTGSTLWNSQPVMAGGSSGATGLIFAVPMDGTDTNNAKTLGGLATSDILPGAVGKVTNFGKVRDIDTTGGLSFGGSETWSDNELLFIDPVNVGYLTNVEPVPPAVYIPICLVVYAHATVGSLLVRVRGQDEAILRTSSIALTTYSATPDRNAQENVHGDLAANNTAVDVNAGDLTLTADTDWGLGKMVIVSNGVAETGTVTITGTSVDRNTGAETGSQVSTVVIDTQTTDAGGTDANGQITRSLTNAYITDKWFTGTDDIVISQTAGSLTDLDIYHIAFEQFGDVRSINIRSLDMTVYCETGDANTKLSAYVYTVEVTGDKVNILPAGNSVVRTGDMVTGKWYRFRRGEIDKQLDGTTDGVFANVSLLGSPAKFRDMTLKIWVDIIP